MVQHGLAVVLVDWSRKRLAAIEPRADQELAANDFSDGAIS
jgi:hypothetical protein